MALCPPSSESWLASCWNLPKSWAASLSIISIISIICLFSFIPQTLVSFFSLLTSAPPSWLWCHDLGTSFSCSNTVYYNNTCTLIVNYFRKKRLGWTWGSLYFIWQTIKRWQLRWWNWNKTIKEILKPSRSCRGKQEGQVWERQTMRSNQKGNSSRFLFTHSQHMFLVACRCFAKVCFFHTLVQRGKRSFSE